MAVVAGDVGLGARLPWDNGHFDAVVVSDNFLAFFPDLPLALRELRRVTKLSGTLLCSLEVSRLKAFVSAGRLPRAFPTDPMAICQAFREAGFSPSVRQLPSAQAVAASAEAAEVKREEKEREMLRRSQISETAAAANIPGGGLRGKLSRATLHVELPLEMEFSRRRWSAGVLACSACGAAGGAQGTARQQGEGGAEDSEAASLASEQADDTGPESAAVEPVDYLQEEVPSRELAPLVSGSKTDHSDRSNGKGASLASTGLADKCLYWGGWAELNPKFVGAKGTFRYQLRTLRLCTRCHHLRQRLADTWQEAERTWQVQRDYRLRLRLEEEAVQAELLARLPSHLQAPVFQQRRESTTLFVGSALEGRVRSRHQPL